MSLNIDLKHGKSLY